MMNVWLLILSLFFAPEALAACNPKKEKCPERNPFVLGKKEVKIISGLARNVARATLCLSCVEETPSADDCKGSIEAMAKHNEFDKVYCDLDKKIVNPFMVMTGFNNTRLRNKMEPACRMYLLEQASVQAADILQKNKYFESEKAVLEFGASLYGLARNKAMPLDLSQAVSANVDQETDKCQVSEMVRTLSLQVMTVLNQDFKASVKNDFSHDEGESTLTQKFCEIVTPACELMGGKQEMVDKKSVCRRGGVIIDESCLRLGTKKRKRMAIAMKSVYDQGALCLFNDFNKPEYDGGKGARMAGQALSDHFNTPESINTQVCCGSKGCQSNLESQFGKYEPLDDKSYQYFSAAARKVDNTNNKDKKNKNDVEEERGYSPKGIIEISDGGLDSIFKTQDEFSATLFHEFLHRIGLPTCPHHNLQEGILKANGGECPIIAGDQYMEVKDMCYPTNACYEESRDKEITQYDVVYACTAACFPSARKSSRNPVEGNDLSKVEIERARELCARYAAHGNFTGTKNISDLPDPPPGVPAQEKNLCKFWQK